MEKRKKNNTFAYLTTEIKKQSPLVYFSFDSTPTFRKFIHRITAILFPIDFVYQHEDFSIHELEYAKK